MLERATFATTTGIGPGAPPPRPPLPPPWPSAGLRALGGRRLPGAPHRVPGDAGDDQQEHEPDQSAFA